MQSWSKSVHTITDDSQNKSIEIDSSYTWGCYRALWGKALYALPTDAYGKADCIGR